MKKILILIFLLIATQAYGAGMVVNPYVCTTPLTCATNTIACNEASGSQAGCLSSTDWTTFNSKLSGGTLTNTKFCTWNSTTSKVDCNSTGGGSPGGSDTQVQFNSGGTAFGGDSALTWNNTTKQLSLANTLAIPNTTSSTTGVIQKGGTRFIHNYQSAAPTVGWNTFLGLGAGNFTMGSATSYEGSYNTCIGYISGQNLSTGWSNTALGANSLVHNTTGYTNVAIGADAMQTATAPDTSVAIGHDSLSGCSSVTQTVAVGYDTSWTCTTSANNTIIGAAAMFSNDTGSNDVAVGYHALYNISSGANNTGLGYNAGANITSGANNIIIGASVNADSATGNNQLNIGNSIKGNLSTKVIDFPGSIRLLETGSTPTYYTKIQSGDLTGADVTLTLPIATGTVMATKVASPGQYWSSECAETCTGGTCTVNFGTACTNGANTVFLTLNNGANSVTLAGGNAGARYLVYVRQPATGAAGTVTWTTVHWMGGNTAPTLSSTNGYVDIVTLGYSGVTSTFYGAFSAY